MTIPFRSENGIATITLDNPPVNVLSGRLMKALKNLLSDLAKNADIKVIIFDSANPHFFSAHVDINILDEQDILIELSQSAPEGFNLFQAFAETLRHQPQITIVKLRGIARGGGAEFVAAADMAFASLEHGRLGQPESLMGIIPGGGATQYLSQRMTRGRALEIILGANTFDAVTAEKYGWINRAIPDAELDTFVDQLALNIASLPEGIISTTKQVLPPITDTAGFIAENNGWAELAFLPRTAEIMKTAMQNGAQTIAGELQIEDLLRSVRSH